MKKIHSLCLTILALASCQHEELAPRAEAEVSGPTYSAVTEVYVPATKTVLGTDMSSFWTEGDCIAIFNGRPSVDMYQVEDACAGSSDGIFNIVEAGAETQSNLTVNIGIYPYQEGLTCGISEITDGAPSAYRIGGFSFPASQDYVSGSFAEDSYAMAAITSGVDDHALSFLNLGGALKLQLTGTALVKSLTLTGNAGEKIAGSAYAYVYPGGKAPSVTMAYDAVTSVVLDCGDGVQLNASEPTVFMFSLPPTDFEEGFTVVMESVEGGIGTLSTTAPNSVGRSKILRMPVAEAKIAEPLENRAYVDEYGINRGRGVLIDGVVWAPVNCGYRPAVTIDRGYPYGKMYQWGRSYGDGFTSSHDNTVATKVAGGSVAISDAADGVFYTMAEGNNMSNWFSDTEYSAIWDGGSSDSPVKSEYDPCPDGWRVPTRKEMLSLTANKSGWSTVSSQNGYWFSGSTSYGEDVPAIFFPAVGWIDNKGYGQSRGSMGRYWTSTVSASGSINYLSMNSSSSSVPLTGTVYGCAVRCVADAGFYGNTEDGIVEVTGISLDQTALEMYEGETYSLKATLIPLEASPEFIIWSSSDEEVAYVDQYGNIYTYVPGDAVITVSSGSVSASCTVTVVEYTEPLADYEDEYGFNHGTGVRIDGVVWAPVNCGFLEPSDSDKGYPYGKVYQWGRPDGFGYSSTYDSTVPEIMEGPVEEEYEFGSYDQVAYWWWYRDDGQDYYDYSNTFISTDSSDSEWFTLPDWEGEEYFEMGYFWNWGSSDEPEKTDTDPCPDGWRLPTFSELESLSRHHSPMSVVDGQKGIWYSGSTEYADGVDAVFLPSGGFLNYMGDPVMRTQCGRYWCSDLSPSLSTTSLYFMAYTNSSGEYVEQSVFGGCRTVNACTVRCVQE